MAFENPLLKPSSTRQAALRYLFSDSPTDEASGTTSGLEGNLSPSQTAEMDAATNTIANIAANIASNGGEYDPSAGISGQADPVVALNALNSYGPTVSVVANALGLGGFVNLAQQSLSNQIDTALASLGGETTGQSSLGLSALGMGLGLMGVPGAGFISGANKDTISNATGFVSNFQNMAQLQGYIDAAKNPALQSQIASMIENPNTITPAQYGTLANYVAQTGNPNVTVGAPIISEVPTPTDLGMLSRGTTSNSYSGAGMSQTQASLRGDSGGYYG